MAGRWLACLCLSAGLFTARADISMRLNTQGVINSPTELSVDGVITPGGFRGICAANVSLNYDPTKFTIGNIRVGNANWTNEITFDHTDIHVYQTLLTSAYTYQYSTGPIMYFTVTPVNGPVDTSDCNVLSLWGGGMDVDFSCHLGSETLETVYIQGGCGGGGVMGASSGTTPMSSGSSNSMPEGANPLTAVCGVNLPHVARALRIWGGLLSATDEDMDAYDRNVDERVDLADVLALLQTDAQGNCAWIPQGWYTFQGNRRHTGRSPYPVSANAQNVWALEGVNALQADARGLPDPDRLSDILNPSPIAVPSPTSQYPLVYVVTTDGADTIATSRVYRIQDNGDGMSPSGQNTPITLPVAGGPPSFVATGTPLFYHGRLFVPGMSGSKTAGYLYVLEADLTLADLGPDQANPIRFTSPLYCSPAPDASNRAVIVYGHMLSDEDPYDKLYWINPADGRSVRQSSALMQDDDGGDLTFVSNTYNAPTVYDGNVYVGNGPGYIIGRRLSDGEGNRIASDLRPGDQSIVSSIAASGGNLYVAGADDGFYGFGQAIGLGASFINDETQSLEQYFWKTAENLNDFWASPAIDQESRTVLMVDQVGQLHFWGMDPTNSHTPEDAFPLHTIAESVIQPTMLRASPLVAGPLNGNRIAFVAADNGTNGQVFAFNMNAAPGTDNILTSKLGNKTLDGRIRSSMAVYKGPDGSGRLYVLTTKGALYCFH